MISAVQVLALASLSSWAGGQQGQAAAMARMTVRKVPLRMLRHCSLPTAGSVLEVCRCVDHTR
jgi:hypothetical protein